MVHKEDRAIYGKIYTQGLAYDLLDLEPQKRSKFQVPAGLRDGVAVFLVADVEGVARLIWVSHWSGYVIVPFDPPQIKPVEFEIVEGDDSSPISNKTLPVAE